MRMDKDDRDVLAVQMLEYMKTFELDDAEYIELASCVMIAVCKIAEMTVRDFTGYCKMLPATYMMHLIGDVDEHV